MVFSWFVVVYFNQVASSFALCTYGAVGLVSQVFTVIELRYRSPTAVMAASSV